MDMGVTRVSRSQPIFYLVFPSSSALKTQEGSSGLFVPGPQKLATNRTSTGPVSSTSSTMAQAHTKSGTASAELVRATMLVLLHPEIQY
eukprot:1435251-Rhodomonas_salina.1